MELEALISRQISQIDEQNTDLPVLAPGSGYMTARDFFRARAFTDILRNSMIRYAQTHGYYPNFSCPEKYNELIFRKKFFSAFKVPESGNKLLTSSFITADIREELSCSDVLWHSHIPVLPDNDRMPPGIYYYKANHGSGFVRRIEYPLGERMRVDLEALGLEWISINYGLQYGEWWYSTFRRELLIEKSIGDAQKTITWLISVSYGEVYRVMAYQKYMVDGKLIERKCNFNPDFTVSIWQSDESDIPDGLILPSQRCQKKMLRFAKKIGSHSQIIRVDFLIDDSDSVYLGEITFAPGNGLVKIPQDYDEHLMSIINHASSPLI